MSLVVMIIRTIPGQGRARGLRGLSPACGSAGPAETSPVRGVEELDAVLAPLGWRDAFAGAPGLREDVLRPSVSFLASTTPARCCRPWRGAFCRGVPGRAFLDGARSGADRRRIEDFPVGAAQGRACGGRTVNRQVRVARVVDGLRRVAWAPSFTELARDRNEDAPRLRPRRAAAQPGDAEIALHIPGGPVIRFAA